MKLPLFEGKPTLVVCHSINIVGYESWSNNEIYMTIIDVSNQPTTRLTNHGSKMLRSPSTKTLALITIIDTPSSTTLGLNNSNKTLLYTKEYTL